MRLVGEGLDGRDTRSDRREKRDGGTEGTTRGSVVIARIPTRIPPYARAFHR